MEIEGKSLFSKTQVNIIYILRNIKIIKNIAIFHNQKAKKLKNKYYKN